MWPSQSFDLILFTREWARVQDCQLVPDKHPGSFPYLGKVGTSNFLLIRQTSALTFHLEKLPLCWHCSFVSNRTESCSQRKGYCVHPSLVSPTGGEVGFCLRKRTHPQLDSFEFKDEANAIHSPHTDLLVWLCPGDNLVKGTDAFLDLMKLSV